MRASAQKPIAPTPVPDTTGFIQSHRAVFHFVTNLAHTEVHG